jgi:Flp pilus assembly protein TadD
MFTVMFRLALAGSLLVAVPACGGGETIVKTVKRDPRQKSAKQLRGEAQAAAAAGKVDQADRAYGEAYATAADAAANDKAEGDKPKLSVDILREWVEFLVHAGRMGRARDVAKQYYDANPADPKGYALLADALHANNKGQEALEVTTQLTQLNGDDAGGHERRGRALLLLERAEDGIEELRKAVTLEPANAKYHMSLGSALHQLGDYNKAALEFRAAL